MYSFYNSAWTELENTPQKFESQKPSSSIPIEVVRAAFDQWPNHLRASVKAHSPISNKILYMTHLIYVLFDKKNILKIKL